MAQIMMTMTTTEMIATTKEKIMEFENLNETLSPEELNKMIAETIWMADRPRTWWEWFSWTFWGRFKY